MRRAAINATTTMPTLEPILLDYANDKLMALKSYDGYIEDLDLVLLRGGYDIKGSEIVKTGSGQLFPFRFNTVRVHVGDDDKDEKKEKDEKK